METPKRPKLKKSNGSEETQSSAAVAAQCLLTTSTASPKTPIRVVSNLDDSYVEEVEQESPQFSHLIPISYNHRRRCGIKDDDEDIRIGWDDGCGSAFFDYDYGPDQKCKRRLMRWSSNSIISSTRQQTVFSKSCLSPKQQNTSPRRKCITNSPINNKKLETELNDYMGFVLSCLSAKTKNKSLKNTSEETENSSLTENSLKKSNVNEKLNPMMDPADDELMFLCSQAIEKMTEQTCDISKDINRLLNCKTETSNTFIKNTLNNNIEIITNNNSSSQVLLKTNCKNINRSPSGHVIKKFKQTLETKPLNNNNNQENNKDKNIISVNNGLLEEEDDDLLLSTIDLSAIEQQMLSQSSSNKTANITQAVIKPNHSKTHSFTPKKTSVNSSTCSGSNNVWRRSSSSSSISLNSKITISNTDNQKQKKNCAFNVLSAIIPNNSNNNNKKCSAAEIQEKHDRARRTLLLKFKEKNKSASFTRIV